MTADKGGPNDIDRPLMGKTSNDDAMGGSDYLQSKLRGLIEEYSDSFSYSAKGRSMEIVPPIEFTVNATGWETKPNRAASKQVSTEK